MAFQAQRLEVAHAVVAAVLIDMVNRDGPAPASFVLLVSHATSHAREAITLEDCLAITARAIVGRGAVTARSFEGRALFALPFGFPFAGELLIHRILYALPARSVLGLSCNAFGLIIFLNRFLEAEIACRVIHNDTFWLHKSRGSPAAIQCEIRERRINGFSAK